jgi:hypothetical protein
MKSFIDSLKSSSDADAAWLLVRLRMGDDIAQVVKTELPRSNEYVRFMRVLQTTIDALRRVLELETVHVADIAAQSTFVDTPEAQMSHSYAPNGIRSDQSWHQDTLQPRLLHQLTWPESAIRPPSCKGPGTDSYDEMGEKFVRVHEVNESSTIVICLVQGDIVRLRGSDDDEEEGLEESSRWKWTRATNGEENVRLVCMLQAFNATNTRRK